MRFWYLLIAILILTPIPSIADSTLVFQEQVGEYSAYNWRVTTQVPDGHECRVTVIVLDVEGRRLLQLVGPVLSADAIFSQPLTVPTSQTTRWSRMHTSIACDKE